MPSESPYRIELKLRDINQLFNSMDPSPFRDKDLDRDADEFIVSWAREYPPDAPLALRIYLEQWPVDDPTPTIRDAVRNHFRNRASMSDLEFSRLMREGRMSLAIGLLFLALSLVFVRALAPVPGAWVGYVRESLTIAGWVAMWRPMQIYLYDWWPLRRRSRALAKLSEMPVEVVPNAGG